MRPALLISLRDPDDPMALQEHRCFQETAEHPVELCSAVGRTLKPDLLSDRPAVFFGGSGAYSVLDSHPWIHSLLDFLVYAATSGVPGYASCFGFQGLALAMGGQVNRDPGRQELGAFEIHLTQEAAKDPLFRLLPPHFYAQLGHHDHVDVLPPGVTLLATADLSHNQAFKVDGAPFWASQFHPELTKSTTYERFLFYLPHYAGDPERAAEIDAEMRSAPDTDIPQVLLRELVRKGLARG
jgi:GMP synthase (glutamine-hydrolysing)